MAKRLPEKEDILKAMQIAGQSPEGAQYLATGFEKVLTKSRLTKQFQSLLDQVKHFAQLVNYKFSASSNAWSGENVSSDIENIQAHLAEDAASKLRDTVKGALHMDVAISDNSEIIRGYTDEGKNIDADTSKLMDTLFNDWLAEEGYVSKDSIIYEKNETGSLIKADPEQVRDLLNHKDFSTHMKKEGFDLSTTQHNYPGEKITSQKQEEQRPQKPSTEITSEEEIKETPSQSQP